MKILILNGSPHLDGATSDMAKAFSEGAKEAGHEVVSINVAHKNIKLYQMDVKSSFLNGYIQEKVYVKQLPRF